MAWEPAKEVNSPHYNDAMGRFLFDKKDVVEGVSRGLVLIKQMGSNVCEVSIFASQNNSGAMLPGWVNEMKLRESIDLLEDLQQKFHRNWYHIDSEIRAAFSEKHMAKNLNAAGEGPAEAEQFTKRPLTYDQLEHISACMASVSGDKQRFVKVRTGRRAKRRSRLGHEHLLLHHI